MIRESGYRFSEKIMLKQKIERDDDSKKSHHALGVWAGVLLIVRDGTFSRRPLLALLAIAPLVAGCGAGADLFSKDADWFSRSGRVFIRNVSIETPPLTPDKPVTSEDLVSADGGCPGMAPQGAADANALADGAAGAPPPPRGRTVPLGRTQCHG